MSDQSPNHTCHKAFSDAAFTIQALYDPAHNIHIVRILHADVQVSSTASAPLKGLGQKGGCVAVPLADRGNGFPHIQNIVGSLYSCKEAELTISHLLGATNSR
jgi:hypothetical protein